MGDTYHNPKPEYVICAAIHFDDGVKRDNQPAGINTGFVIAGRRHHNCFGTAFIIHEDNRYLKHEKEQGFLTSRDRFVSRKEAGIIAFTQGQTKELHYTLFSEDLY